jgi:hypothetical protein
MDKIPANELVERRLYRVHARNFNVAVYDGHDGFIGIREKFGNVYLFTEFEWETGAPYGTVQALEDLGRDVPWLIPLAEDNPELFTWLEQAGTVAGD